MTNRNITDNEKIFNQNRSKLINKVEKEYIADAPSVFANRIGIQNLITRYELYKLILDVPGDIIECGVYKGNSFSFLANLSVILEPFAINRRLIGFDTFEGFQSINKANDPKDITSKNFSDTSQEVLQSALDNLDSLRPVNRIKRFELVKGDICKTVPDYISKHSWMTCAMLILDTDLYEPTKVALSHIMKIMPKGAIIVFDEYNYQNFPGETQALLESLNINDFKVKKFPYESCTSFIIL
jgi:hypothetical protein